MNSQPRRLAALALCASLVLAGCGDLIDIDRRALVVGVGLDQAPGGYQVTVEYPAPGSGGEGGGGGGGLLGGGQSGGGMTPKVISASGRDVGLAVERIRPETSRFIYFGNLGVIAFGQALAAQGVLAPLDYFLRQGEVAEVVQLVVASGEAGTLLQTKGSEGVGLPMFEYLRTAESAHEPTAPTPLWRFLAMTDSAADAAYLPVMAPSIQGQPFRSVGTALFRGGRMVAELTGVQGNALDWLVKHAGYPTAQVTLPGSTAPVTLRVAGVRRSWRVLSPERALLTVRLNTTISEGFGLVLDSRDVTAWQQAASEQLQLQIRQVLDVLQQDGVDILGLADQVHVRYPRATADWPLHFSGMRLDVAVAVSIHGAGRRY